ncbi:MAG: hypothetical protein RI553_12670, partial [Salibaculum sp.]|uniref:hypothetical protein n=1 Tax=Salibaculum sp. TaxID=2855480 RepID=UPI00287029F4
DGARVLSRLGHDDLLFGLASAARGLAGEGCGLARPRRVVWSWQVRGEWLARHFFQFLQQTDLKEVGP